MTSHSVWSAQRLGGSREAMKDLSNQESAEWPEWRRTARRVLSGQESTDQSWRRRITRKMTSLKSVTEEFEGRCVIGRGSSGHEADEQSPASNRPSGPDAIQLVCFCWIKALSAHSDHCIVM